jgi:hypothetical protein
LHSRLGHGFLLELHHAAAIKALAILAGVVFVEMWLWGRPTTAAGGVVPRYQGNQQHGAPPAADGDLQQQSVYRVFLTTLNASQSVSETRCADLVCHCW